MIGSHVARSGKATIERWLGAAQREEVARKSTDSAAEVFFFILSRRFVFRGALAGLEAVAAPANTRACF